MDINSFWEKIKAKNLQHFEKELSVFGGKMEKIRGNRINLEVVRGLILNHKGTNKPLKAVASFRIFEGELVVSNFEPKLYSLIKNTVLEKRSEYQLAEKSTSTELYFVLALMTKEGRDKLVREVSSIANVGNTEIDKVRENFRKEVKKEKSFSQDQTKKYEKQIDEFKDDYKKKLAQIAEKKIKELRG